MDWEKMTLVSIFTDTIPQFHVGDLKEGKKRTNLP